MSPECHYDQEEYWHGTLKSSQGKDYRNTKGQASFSKPPLDQDLAM